MAAVGQAGSEYGLSLHWGKIQLLSVRSAETIHTPDGTIVTSKNSMIYLGGLLSRDGHGEKELSRRLGMAHADFKALTRLWSHANVTKTRKLDVFNGIVANKLL